MVYELFGNPYQSTVVDAGTGLPVVQPNNKFSYNTISAGIGYRIDNVSFDLSYSLGRKTDFNYLYTNNDPVKYQRNLNEIVFTMYIKL